MSALKEKIKGNGTASTPDGSTPDPNWPNLPSPDQYVSPEEYFKILEESDVLLEWIDGVIYPRHDPYREVPQAMAGASDAHIDIHFELSLAVGNALKGTLCRAVTPDQKVSCGNSYAFPDLTIYCGEREKDENGWLTNAAVIFEVLSPGTSKYDRNLKWDKYREMDSLRDYLLVWQDKPLIEHRRRQKKNKERWELIYYNRLDDEIALDSIHAKLRLAEIYARLDFSSLPPTP